MKERTRPQSLLIPHLQLDRSAQNNSIISPRRRKNAFMTQTNQKEQGQFQELYKQLNSVIEGMDIKIQDVIDRHQAQFLLAYRNHMKKIKQQLEEIRMKLTSAEANSNSFDKISALEKQLVLFREEALKLYDDLEQKNLECEKYKLQLDQEASQNKFLENEVKKLMKRTKFLEVYYNNNTNLRSIAQSQHQVQKTVEPLPIKADINNLTLPPGSRRAQSRKIRTADTNRLSEGSSFLPIDRIRDLVNNDNLFHNIKEVIVEADQSRSKKIDNLSNKYAKLLKISNTETTRTSQLEEFFLKCVDTVRKQILKRNHMESKYLPDVIDYQSFRKLDCMKVIELLVTNERVKTIVYNELFGKVIPSTSTIINRRGGTRSSRQYNPGNTSHPIILQQP